jgi:predicted nuclease of predicted toxin-antitoxin system
MSIGLLANENFPGPALRRLRAAGVDVVAVVESLPAAKDVEVLEFARANGRWIVTFDRDYGELVFKRGALPPPAIIYLRQEPYPAERPADIVLALLSNPSLAEGHMLVVSERGIQRRRMPPHAGVD